MRSSSALTDQAATSPGTCTVLGVEYFIGDLRTATEAVIERARGGGGGYSCLCGVHGIVTAQHSDAMMRALDGAWLNFPDGAPVAWLMRRFGARGARRVAGPDLMPLVIDAGQDVGLRHFLFGSTPDVLERLQARLLERYPRAVIVGTFSPPFRPLTDDENAAIARQIIDSGADVVWAGLGLPKQDQWLERSAELFRPAIGLGVGAAFDFHAGLVPQAPPWMQQAGLEWAYRLTREPRRLWRRYLRYNPRFVGAFALQLTKTLRRTER